MNMKMTCNLFAANVLFVAVVLSSHGLCGEVYKKSSLIVPQGISYRFTPISFTRDVKVVDGRFETKSIKAKDTSGTAKLDSEDHSASDSATTKDTTIEKNSGVKANAGASAKAGVSLWTGIRASAEVHGGVDVHGGIERNSKQTDYSARSSANKTDMFSTHANSFRVADSVEDSMRGKYGDWYLTFAMYIKNLDVSDVCYVHPTNGIPLSAVVEGLSQPIVVPCERQHTIRIGIEEVVCRFTAPVHDQKLLRELMALEEARSMDKLSIQIDGANFPITSQSTGKNILQEMKLVEMKNPTTEIRLGFGEAKVLSPWRVKQRFGRSSGRRGQLVTLRDALDALNDKIAEDDSMPEQVFECNVESNLCAVSENRLGSFNVQRKVVPCIKFDNDLANSKVRILDGETMATPIKKYRTIELFELPVEEVLVKYHENPQKYNDLYHEFVHILKKGDSNIPEIRLELGALLLASDEKDERLEGCKMLYSYWEKSNDIRAIKRLFDEYLIHSKEFPYRDKVADWIREFAKDEQWVANASNSSLLDNLIKNDQVDAVIKLSKVPSFACSSSGITALMRVAASGNVPMAKALLKEIDFDVNEEDKYGWTALLNAAWNDKVEMCKFLVGIGADPNKTLTLGTGDRYRRTAVEMIAARRNAMNTLKYLVEQAGGELRHAHFCAAEGGAFEAMQYLMEKAPIGVNEVWEGMPLLSYAAMGGNLQLCRYLVEKGAFVEYGEEEVARTWNFPICVAAAWRHLEVMNFLLEQGAKFRFAAASESLLNNCENWLEEKITAHKIDAGNVLLAAISQNKVDAVKKIIRFVDNINTGIGNNKWLPLAWAAQCNSVDAARELIKAGAKVSFSLEGEYTPLQQACRAGSLDMVKFLYAECGAVIDDAVFLALKNKQKAVVDWFLKYEREDGSRPFEINTYYHGRRGSLLMAAAEMSDPEMCEFLFGNGADIDFKPEGKCSVLEYVMRIDNLPILRYLVDQRGCVVGDEILEAARYGSMKCLKYLIEEKRMSVNTYTKEGGSLLMLAVCADKTDAFEYLLDNGANINFRPEGKCSVLEYVMRTDNLPILRYLVDRRECVVKDEILEAARCGSMNCLKYLIEERRMSPNYCSKNKRGFLLGEAAGKGKTDVCYYLLSKGANVNFSPVYEERFMFDGHYKTALQMARDNGHTTTAEYLVKWGASNE